MARVLYITTSQPGSNPRLRKSADTMSGAGHQVHVLYLYKSAWATDADAEIFESAGWTHQLVGGSPSHNRWRYFISRLVRKAAELLGHRKRAFCRGYSEFLRHGRAFKPTLIVGHNPGALGPIVTLGDRLGVPVVFDAEDYHRGEFPEHTKEAKETALLEEELLPKVTAMTAASPLIAEAYRSQFHSKDIVTINNAFPLKYIAPETTPINTTSQLRVVWFSQVIGSDRGLIEFISGLSREQRKTTHLTLIGNCTPEMKVFIEDQRLAHELQVRIVPPMPEKELMVFIRQHDVGLALEKNTSLNRDLCRTNKLYTYPLCGLWTIASNTSAQEEFLKEHPYAGILINLDEPDAIEEVLNWADSNREELLQHRIKALALAKEKLNWEHESLRLQEYLGSLVNS